MLFTPLGEYRKCPVCGERDFAGRHTCPPRFEARYEHDEDSDFAVVYARDAGAAAERFHEQRFADTDYARDVVVIVRNAERRRVTFDVHVEAVPEFSASQVKEWGEPEPSPDEESEAEQEI